LAEVGALEAGILERQYIIIDGAEGAVGSTPHAFVESIDDVVLEARATRIGRHHGFSLFRREELKRAGVGYKELAGRLNAHGLEETETSITGKLARGTFAASFFLAYLVVLELELDGVQLEDL